MSCERPRLPIPEPLRGLQGSSFTIDSIKRRLPAIVRQMVTENDLEPAALAAIEKLVQEIPTGRIRPLDDPHAPDARDWKDYCARYVGQNWLEAPWFFVETYFYRRILEAIGYFRPGSTLGLDPFRFQKRRGLDSAVRALELESRRPEEEALTPDDALSSLLRAALWGNQADLSMWPAGDGPRDGGMKGHPTSRLLVDDRLVVIAYLSALHGQAARVDFLVDNAGHELVADLRLADFLLRSDLAKTVWLHLKIHPTFVSDAIAADVVETIAALTSSPGLAGKLGRRLQVFLDGGQLRLTDHPFWTSPLAAWQMPPDLKAELAAARLLISKGDANYRRLLGDRQWPYTTSFDDITCYLPAPLVALRTLKSEVAAGLRPGQPETVAQQDPEWLTDGLWGVIQYTNGGG